jgi:hypothetical protein
MNNELPIPYTDYLFIEPVAEVGIVSSTLNCYAKVLAIGPDVKNTKVGEYVAFEKWDKPEFLMKNKQVAHFLRESEAICKLPESWV